MNTYEVEAEPKAITPFNVRNEKKKNDVHEAVLPGLFKNRIISRLIQLFSLPLSCTSNPFLCSLHVFFPARSLFPR